MNKVTHIKFDYFKDTGKWYTDSELSLPYRLTGERYEPVPFYECVAYVRAMLNRSERPGLVNGYDFHVLITVYTEHGPLQHFFVRTEGALL